MMPLFHTSKKFIWPPVIRISAGGSMDWLLIVRFQFELDPYDKNTLFLFCGRKKQQDQGTK